MSFIHYIKLNFKTVRNSQSQLTLHSKLEVGFINNETKMVVGALTIEQ